MGGCWEGDGQRLGERMGVGERMGDRLPVQAGFDRVVGPLHHAAPSGSKGSQTPCLGSGAGLWPGGGALQGLQRGVGMLWHTPGPGGAGCNPGGTPEHAGALWNIFKTLHYTYAYL